MGAVIHGDGAEGSESKVCVVQGGLGPTSRWYDYLMHVTTGCVGGLAIQQGLGNCMSAALRPCCAWHNLPVRLIIAEHSLVYHRSRSGSWPAPSLLQRPSGSSDASPTAALQPVCSAMTSKSAARRAAVPNASAAAATPVAAPVATPASNPVATPVAAPAAAPAAAPEHQPELELKRLTPVVGAAAQAAALAGRIYTTSKAYVPERLQGTVAAAEGKVAELVRGAAGNAWVHLSCGSGWCVVDN